jgi:Domain of unknown function (DUF4136)
MTQRSLLSTLTILGVCFSAPLSLVSKVKIFPSTKYDIATYETYQWLPPRVMTRQGLQEDDPILTPIIKQVVNKHLSAKGYREVAEGGELNLLTGGFSETNSQLEGFLVTYGFDYYYGWFPTTAAPVTRVNREGTFLVGLIDAKTNEGVWLGLSTALIGGQKDIDKTINKAASNLLKKLPQSQRKGQ